MSDKEKKAEYDRLYRLKNKERLRLSKQAYCESEAGRLMQKRQREKRKEYHNEYCCKPEQRVKEKIRRRVKYGLTKLKKCLDCNLEKELICFANSTLFEDKHYYLCHECEKLSKEKTGLSTRNVINTIHVRSERNLSRHDIAKHPYLIEANKYLISLKKLVL